MREAGSLAHGVRRHRPDVLMLLFMAILLLLGLIVIYAISPALTARINAAGNTLDQNHFMYRQLMYLAAGVLAFAVTALTPLGFWRKIQGKLLIGGIILGSLPFLLQQTPLALCANGACRWINLGFVTFQPAEVIKFALVIFLASFLAARIQQGKLNNLNHTLIPVGLILLAVAVIVIGLQKDLGTGITIFSVVMTMLFVGGLERRYLTLAVGASLLLGVVFTVIAPHRVERIMTFFNHQNVTDDGMGYHINQALIAIGSGGLTGKGLGQSVQAFGYLPEAANDSIFAILAEKFGFLGTVAVLALFAALFLRILRTMDHTPSPYFKLIVAGVFGWVVSHTIVNVGAMLGIFPLTGITLPFVSFGGTSLLFMLSALGLVFHISRYTSHRTDIAETEGGSVYDYRVRGRRLGRARDAGIGRPA
ncbi:MAG: FtsW/RodA/SpoVE family cell cycle protein [Candidatus Saccharimonadales bacterium]